MDKKITFVMRLEISKKLDLLKEVDKRSIQKEIEWLIERRAQEIEEGK